MKKLNFGCGNEIFEGYDNFDKKDFDFNIFPYPIKDNTYDYIYSKCVLEHLIDIEKVLEELHRICKNDGEIFIIVPYYNSSQAYGHVGHTHYFNADSFRSLRELKGYNINVKLVPSKMGFLIPFREFFSRYIGGLIKQIHITFEVYKFIG